ncbi:unannotated protein [freshwater metagenome]|uniref:Unannotated protein n=1 Tax=freshwater metagenome TaxID=449393 RepID=A0A6J7H607_9ZZZZ
MKLSKPLRPTCTAATTVLEESNKGMQSATRTASATPGVVVINASHVGSTDVTESITAKELP